MIFYYMFDVRQTTVVMGVGVVMLVSVVMIMMVVMNVFMFVNVPVIMMVLMRMIMMMFVMVVCMFMRVFMCMFMIMLVMMFMFMAMYMLMIILMVVSMLMMMLMHVVVAFLFFAIHRDRHVSPTDPALFRRLRLHTHSRDPQRIESFYKPLPVRDQLQQRGSKHIAGRSHLTIEIKSSHFNFLSLHPYG